MPPTPPMPRFMMRSAGKQRPLTFAGNEDRPVVLASGSTAWAGIPFEVHDLLPLDSPWEGGPAPGDSGMTMLLQGTQTLVLQGRRQEQLTVEPGMVSLVGMGSGIALARAIGEGRLIVFRFGSLWQAAIADGGPTPEPRLAPLPPSQTALSLALAMTSEVENGAPSGALFAECLSLALLQHVVQRSPVSKVRVRGAMSEYERRRIARYIDENLHRDLSLIELAGITRLRPRQFSTIFRNAFGTTPHRYLVQRRVERGARLLAATSVDITELALSLGFSSQSHFSTAFRKRFGLSPRQYVLSRRVTIAGS